MAVENGTKTGEDRKFNAETEEWDINKIWEEINEDWETVGGKDWGSVGDGC